MAVSASELIAEYTKTKNPRVLWELSKCMNMRIQDFDELLTLTHTKINYFPDTTDLHGLHTHTFYELLFICKSSGMQYQLDSSRYRLASGDLLIVPPGMIHGPLHWSESSVEYERFSLFITSAFLESQKQTFPDLDFCFSHCRQTGVWLLRFSNSEASDLYARFSGLWKERQMRNFAWDSAIGYGACLLLNIINRYVHDRLCENGIVEQNDLFDIAYQYIDTHLTEKITVDALAEYLHVSRSTVTHMFQKHLQLSFYQCVTQKRLLRAKSYILNGAPLNNVWEYCGFGDYSSFYRMFKKEYGLSPRDFLKIYSSANSTAVDE